MDFYYLFLQVIQLVMIVALVLSTLVAGFHIVLLAREEINQGIHPTLILMIVVCFSALALVWEHQTKRYRYVSRHSQVPLRGASEQPQ